MRYIYPRPAAAVIALTLFSASGLGFRASGLAQSEAPALTGEVRGAPGPLESGYAVVLEDMTSRRVAGPVDVQPDGTFQLGHVPSGDYIVKLQTYFGELIRQEFVNVAARSETLIIQLPGKAPERPPSGGVAAARLEHPPAKKALRAFVAADKLSNSGRYAEAARQLERAIEISPGYADAHSNLGAQYVRLGRYRDGISQITEAMRIGNPSAVDLTNLACAQYELRRFDEGLVSARAALAADPASQNAHYILGLLLAQDRRTLGEAVHHLEMAESIASARTALERVRAMLAAAFGPAGAP